MQKRTEKFLTIEAAAGDPAALATLLECYERDLVEYANRRLPQKVRHLTAPEDIVQETCYEACRMIAGFAPQGEGSFYRWLTRIANYRMKAVVQRYRSRRTDVVSAGMNDESSVIGALAQLSVYRRTPSQSAAAHEFMIIVERCLGQLSAQYREVITHRFLDGLSPEETAQKMARNINQIYVLSSRALDALRTKLVSATRFT